MDNEAAIKAATDNSSHSGFATSLCICKALDAWFKKSPTNLLEIRWFPSHKGLVLNECADTLAGASFPFVWPKPTITSASHRHTFMLDAVKDWHSQALPLIQQRQLCLKGQRNPLLLQLWGKSGQQFYHLVNNDITLFSHFTCLISSHALIGSYCQKFFPLQNRQCPTDGRFQDIEHVTIQCPKYAAKFSSFPDFLLSKNNTKKSIDFLKQNLTAVSFEDQPLDIDLPP